MSQDERSTETRAQVFRELLDLHIANSEAEYPREDDAYVAERHEWWERWEAAFTPPAEPSAPALERAAMPASRGSSSPRGGGQTQGGEHNGIADRQTDHAANVKELDRMMLELDAILVTLDHDGAKEFGDAALAAIRNLRAVEAALA